MKPKSNICKHDACCGLKKTILWQEIAGKTNKNAAPSEDSNAYPFFEKHLNKPFPFDFANHVL